MTAIQVARTDTFEQQRQKINDISTALFNVTSGGSDLSTGNLKLGDGAIATPSLAFTTDNSLGIYKPSSSTLGFVASSKSIFDLSLTELVGYQSFKFRQKKLSNSFLTILSGGQNYDAGSYTGIPVTGGTGQNAVLNLDVIAWDGSITNAGSDYNEGQFSSVPLSGGNGSGADATFNVSGLEGDITDAGSAYKPGTYVNVPLTGGNGSSAEASITITGATNVNGTITNAGSGYTTGNYPFVQFFNDPVQTFVVTAVVNPNAGQANEPNFIYNIDGSDQPILNMVAGNAYRFDMSDSTLQGANPGQPGSDHRITFQTAAEEGLDTTYYTFYISGDTGNPGAFAELVIKPGAPVPDTIRYDCANHEYMGPAGGNINVTSGATTQYFTAVYGSTDVAGGLLTTVAISDSGQDLKAGDTLLIAPADVGNGSGFEYDVSSISYTGTVNQVTVTENGSGYLENDVLSASDSLLGNGGGSGFEFTVSGSQGIISDFTIGQRGTNYQVGDVLTLPTGVNNVSTYAPGQSGIFTTTVTSGSATVTLSDTSSLQAGLFISTSAGDTGQINQGVTILSIDSPTQITMSENATVSGAVNLSFQSSVTTQITVPDTSGIEIGFLIEKVSGTGVFDTGTTVANVDDATTITLSAVPTTLGPVVVNFTPPWGQPVDSFAYTINVLGTVDTISLTEDGNGYSVDDILSVSPTDLTQPITIPVLSKDVQTVTFIQTVADSVFSVGDSIFEPAGAITNISSSGGDITPTVTGPLTATLSPTFASVTLSSTTGISAGDFVTESLSGNISPGTTVASVDSATQITLSQNPLAAATVDLTFTSDETGSFTGVSASGGNGSNATFDVVRSNTGFIGSVTVNAGGLGYSDTDVLTIAGTDIGGASPANDISVTVSSVTTSSDLEILDVRTSGGNITSLLINVASDTQLFSSDSVQKTGTTSPTYTIDTASDLGFRFFLDPGDGNGSQLHPDLTLYVGSTYEFDLSDASMSAHQFSLSAFRDGSNTSIDNISTTLDVNSENITVASTAGILVGMSVVKVSGDGELDSDTFVESIVDGTTITMTKLPTTEGSIVVNFVGTEYSDGVIKEAGSLSLKVTSDTVSPLYYYCGSGVGHEDEGGEDGQEAQITIDPNNPKQFGSGLQIRATNIVTSDVITSDILTGLFTAATVSANQATITNISGSQVNYTQVTASQSVTTPTLSSAGNLNILATTSSFNGNVNIGPFAVTNSTGALSTSGEIKTFGQLNINDTLFVNNNIVTSAANTSIVFQPSVNQVVTVNADTAFGVPVGDTSQRPLSAVSGQIRFNTDSNQYEGYSTTASAWSSLGGVRDLDGNTYILAEETIGANDNTLWFINDTTNTVKFTPNRLEFRASKLISSTNTSAPAYVEWTANAPVSVGDYIKHKNNLYEVISAGTTGTTGNAPNHTSGTAANGSATLEFWGLAVAPLTFQDIEEIRVGPTQPTSLVINQELRFANNVISTDVSDLILQPNAGQKIVCNVDTTLVVPVGTDLTRGAPSTGSIRFNTTSSQFEGYDDNGNWGSLGGVKDVDQNTYIIPESAPGANENILYFYNDGTNTMQLTTNALDFLSVDTIRSQTSGEFEITANLMTFNNAETTLDNTVSDTTFLHTSKQFFDIGLSAGLTVDPVLRLDNQGDVFLNIGFGTGVYDGVKIFDSDLKEFELADLKILSEKLTLVAGTVNNAGSNIFDIATQNGAKVVVVAENTTTNAKEFFEFGVIDDGTDIFHTQYGNVRTDIELVTPTFERTGSGFARVNFAIGSGVTAGENVVITIVSNVTKK